MWAGVISALPLRTSTSSSNLRSLKAALAGERGWEAEN